MAGIKIIKEGLKVAGPILINLQPLVDPVIEIVKEKLNERKDLVDIPELYSKGLPINLEQAINLLEGCGLKIVSIPVPVKEARVIYKDCFESQIVDSKPKHKQKVKPGTILYLKYVTSEVIEESHKLFDEAKQRKAELKLEKADKRYEQKEKQKKIIAKIQHGASDNITKMKYKIKKAMPHHNKKNKPEELSDPTIDL